MSIDRELQSIADKEELRNQIDEMGPLDYAVLIRFRHTDQEGKTGYVSPTRTCFSHVAIGLLDEARQIMRRDHEPSS